MGQMRWAKNTEGKLNVIKSKIRNGLAFSMSKVAIVDDAKKPYTHTPIQIVVNVSDTQLDPLLHSKEHEKGCPEPPAVIAECENLTKAQVFDVIGLVKTISPVRPLSTTDRVAFDIEIIDGSTTGHGVRTMPPAVWTERRWCQVAGIFEPPTCVFLHIVLNEETPEAFFRTKGAQDDDEIFLRHDETLRCC